MNSQVLIESLNAQDKNLALLIESLENQKAAIIKNDYTLLDKETLSEQRILSRIEKEEVIRHKVIREISKEFLLDIEKESVDELLRKGKNLPGKEFKKIENLRFSIKEKLLMVVNLNTQLKDVINFSRNLIRETLVMVAGQNKHALVNKRV